MGKARSWGKDMVIQIQSEHEVAFSSRVPNNGGVVVDRTYRMGRVAGRRQGFRLS